MKKQQDELFVKEGPKDAKEEARGTKEAGGTEIVKESDFYRVIDSIDEQEIVKSLSQGIVSEKWCYAFNIGGREIYGIGYEGAKQLAILTGGVCIDGAKPPVVLGEDAEKIRVAVYGGLVRKGSIVFGIWGVSEQAKKTGDKKNEKAFIIACSKAQRNAILSLIPEGIKNKAIEHWKKIGKVYSVPKSSFERKPEIKFGE